MQIGVDDVISDNAEKSRICYSYITAKFLSCYAQLFIIYINNCWRNLHLHFEVLKIAATKYYQPASFVGKSEFC